MKDVISAGDASLLALIAQALEHSADANEIHELEVDIAGVDAKRIARLLIEPDENDDLNPAAVSIRKWASQLRPLRVSSA